MALIIKDRLAQILNETTHNQRHDIWLWLHLVSDGAQIPYSVDKRGMRDKLAASIYSSTNPKIIETIKNKRNEQLVSIEKFNWVNDGKRQIEWLMTKTLEVIGRYNFSPPNGLEGKNLLIAKFDIWHVDITQKTLALRDLEMRWHEHTKADKIFNWFKDDDQKCVTAWEWLTKNNYSGIHQSHSVENYDDLMFFFDNSNFLDDQKLFYIDKIKKRWSQTKYRQGQNGKNQYNFILSDKAITRLDSLAETYERSRTQILEILLKMESEKKLYIAEQVKIDKSY